MNLTDFVIDNCVRQSATEPKDFIGMTLACNVGYNFSLTPITLNKNVILRLGRLVNNNSTLEWRNTPVVFANGNNGAPATEIPRLLTQLLSEQDWVSAETFYWEFERIHPFTDGNGRVGAILYSILRDTFWVNPPEMQW